MTAGAGSDPPGGVRPSGSDTIAISVRWLLTTAIALAVSAVCLWLLLSPQIVASLARLATQASLLPVLFKRALDLHQTTFAMGESIAHLNALWLAGELGRTLGDDGVIRFQTR